MHELAITEAIVHGVVERMGSARIVGMRLVIGELSGVVPESVRFCFDLVAEGTTVQGAWLDIDRPRGRVWCHRCREESEIDEPIVLCRCGSADVELVAGTELRIESVEVR